MIVMSRETVAQVRQDIGSLLEEHYQELTLHKDVVKLNVDWHYYYSMEKSGKLCAFCIRNEGALIGYSVFVLNCSHPHYKDLAVASNDVLFLKKEFRKGLLGCRIIKESENILAAMGYQKILWHTKMSNDVSKLLKLLGYDVEDIVLGKILEA